MSAKTDRQDRNNVDRLPPNDIPAEKATLGAILSVKPGAAGRVKECQLQFGTDEVFYDLRNQEIWHAMEYLVSRDLELDVITLQFNLLDRKLEAGIEYAHERGIGIVVMGPVGGGRLGVRNELFEKLAPGIKGTPSAPFAPSAGSSRGSSLKKT